MNGSFMIRIVCFAVFFVVAGSCRVKKQVAAEEKAALRQTYAGEFMYFADAPVFRLCGEQKVFPVVMEKAYINAERQYLKQTEGGTWVYTEFTGEVVQKKNEDGGLVSMYTMESLVLMDKNKRCPKK